MKIDRLTVRAFKNLRDFSIDFNEKKLNAILIGENGSGKSNLFEAIATIFRSLDLDEAVPFDYEIVYQLGSAATARSVHIKATRSAGRGTVYIGVRRGDEPEQVVTRAAFARDRDAVLPAYIFAYYSGPGHRLEALFERHLEEWYRALLKNVDGRPERELRRMFYCLPTHSRFVLLAYFIQGLEPRDKEFLKDYFGVTALDSAMLTLREPDWSKAPDDRFWGSRGLVSTFLEKVWHAALAPLRLSVSYKPDFRKRPRHETRVHLYLPDLDHLRSIAKGWESRLGMFSALESVFANDLLYEMRLWVRSGSEVIPFTELSEGEQQLLTVVGLLRFTGTADTLFLLDEPDTHLNPKWKLKYLRLLEQQVEATETCQILLSTHDPLTIADLERSQVHIFTRDSKGGVHAEVPPDDPRGLGVGGVLTELFGLPTTLDETTQAALDRRDYLAGRQAAGEKRLNNGELAELEQLNEVLHGQGFRDERRDPLEQRFLSEWRKLRAKGHQPLSKMSVTRQRQLVNEILQKLMEEQSS